MELLAKAVNCFCKELYIRYMTMPWICLSHFWFLISTFSAYWLKVFQEINSKASAWKVFSCSHLGFLKNPLLMCKYSDFDDINILRLTMWHHLFLEFWSVGTWFFTDWRHQCAVTRLENVRQSNIRRSKKLGFQLSHRHPP